MSEDARKRSFAAARGSSQCYPSPARSAAIGAATHGLGTPSTRPRQVRGGRGDRTFLVWPMTKDERHVSDTIHEDIVIPPAVQVILDSPYVQRLGNLKQLGCTFNAYPCCTHTRKEHSLGVMELAGRLAAVLQQKQPQLEISEKDILCVRIAGLCHDLGHGPFSHAFEHLLAAVRENERDHPEQYTERNDRFRDRYGVEIPPIPEHYEHEETSLVMIDAALASVGLEIDWFNLDSPLKQVGDGIDREKFGVRLVKQSDDGEDRIEPLTSRDMIFIKECVLGGPLNEPHAPTAQKTFVGREWEKEFLFDIVNNRHNGLDVDKMDYFDRDSAAAYGASAGSLNIFIRDALVARVSCPDDSDGRDVPGERLMICYPKKHVSTAMDFFTIRMKNHEKVYTHKKTKGVELQLVDLLLEADKHFCMLQETQRDDPFRFPVPTSFAGFEFSLLPLSRAWMYPPLFLRMDDEIISIVETQAIVHSSPQLRSLRELLNNRRSHKFYKCVTQIEVGTQGGEDLWKMSGDEIKKELFDTHNQYTIGGELVRLDPNDVIVEKRTLHYGRKDKNPVSQMRFLEKSDQILLHKSPRNLPLAVEVQNLPNYTPSSFLRQTIRFFCRNAEKHEFVTHAFASWEQHKMQKAQNPNCQFEVFYDDDDEEEDPDSQPITQDEDGEILITPRKRSDSDDSSASPAKKRLAFD